MPKLTTLHITKSRHLNIQLASRFRDVRDIHISSLLSTNEFTCVHLDLETRHVTVPFLQVFPKLKGVYFAGRDEAGGEIEHFSPADAMFTVAGDEHVYPNEGSTDSMNKFIDSISRFQLWCLAKEHEDIWPVLSRY